MRMRLIDADAVNVKQWFASPDNRKRMTEALAAAPTIDAETVRHGRWVKDKERNTYCSVCDCYIPAVHCRQDYQDDFSEWDEEIDETDYCPHCGSKMDAKEA